MAEEKRPAMIVSGGSVEFYRQSQYGVPSRHVRADCEVCRETLLISPGSMLAAQQTGKLVVTLCTACALALKAKGKDRARGSTLGAGRGEAADD